MEHLELIEKYGLGSANGLEIGAWIHPIPGIRPTYVDCFETFAGEPCLLDLKGDSCHLPVPDDSQCYVATSHVLEHVANPFLALKEWARVLRNGGLIYAVVPDMRVIWDRERVLTSTAHLWADFEGKVTQVDGSHIDEFLDGVVWEEFSPASGPEKREELRNAYRAAIAQGLEINIHFHTFTPDSMQSHLASVNERWSPGIAFETLEVIPAFPGSCPNGFVMVLRVNK